MGAKRSVSPIRLTIAFLLGAAFLASVAQAAPLAATVPEIRAEDLRAHVLALTAPEMAGRRTGTEGERLATAYVSAVFEAIGLRPDGDNGTYFQTFEAPGAALLGPGNRLRAEGLELGVDEQWRPLGFSRNGPVETAPFVFAGYGIVAPAGNSEPAYDSYTGVDARGRWVLVLRGVPRHTEEKRRLHLARHATMYQKAVAAREQGARGLIFARGSGGDGEELVPLRYNPAAPDCGIAVCSVMDAVAEGWLQTAGLGLDTLQDALDTGADVPGFELPSIQIEAVIDVRREQRAGRNVLGRLWAGESRGATAVVLGAHVDHLGADFMPGSLAKNGERDQPHPGADDNASGVAALLELAQRLADLRARGGLEMRHDILFAAWSGEEMGLLGSSHYCEAAPPDQDGARVTACLNLDMVGRLRQALAVQGVATSSAWEGMINRANVYVGLPLQLEATTSLPTDTTSFYLRGVPFLNLNTGLHDDYHTPRDTVERLNYEGLERVTQFMERLAREAVIRESFDFIALPEPPPAEADGYRAYLGTIPDYAFHDALGVRLAGVTKGGPADRAGLRAGDVIVEIAGRPILNIEEYTGAIRELEIGKPIPAIALRGAERVEVIVTPGGRAAL